MLFKTFAQIPALEAEQVWEIEAISPQAALTETLNRFVNCRLYNFLKHGVEVQITIMVIIRGGGYQETFRFRYDTAGKWPMLQPSPN